MRQHQPPALVIWGKWTPCFEIDEKVDEIAALMHTFLRENRSLGNPHEK